MLASTRTTDLPSYLQNYLRKARGQSVAEALENALERTMALFGAEKEERGLYRYAEGKWSIKEVVQHLNDCERIFSYRALRFARTDGTALPPFDENAYTPAAEADRLPLASILAEHQAIRAGTLALFASFSPAMMARSGLASGVRVQVEQLGFIAAGHAEHHCDIHEERYR
ncbi:MAG: DinB family protein [Flavobacteriales bacterium]